MDLEKLKGKLDDATLSELQAHIQTLTEQRDDARKESRDGRLNLKSKLEAAEGATKKLLEKLGIDSVEDLDTIQTKPGNPEQVKQLETKVKRLEADLIKRNEDFQKLEGDHRQTVLDSMLTKSLSKFDFIDGDLVADYVKNRIVFEDGKPLIRGEGDRVMPIDEGIATIAKSKPHLLKAAGNGGSGYRPNNGGKAETNPWKKESLNLTEQQRLKKENPTLAAQMAEAAKAA
jgi:hypothetical protein